MKFNPRFNRGRSRMIESIWLISQVLFSSWLPGTGWRCFMLKLFGAKIGKDVIIKPRVFIKFPWRLTIGHHTWIGEKVWIDNLDQVIIGNNVCLSQGAYLCTGNHDYKKDTFDLITKPILVEDECWLCAFSKIAPGVTIKKGSIVGFGAVLMEDTKENSLYAGNPAKFKKNRF